VKRIALLLVFVVLLVGNHVGLTRVRDARPPEARLGFYPPTPVIKALTADQYQFTSQLISLQCLFYFGTLVELRSQAPDWWRIYRAVYTSTRLDPYNMDGWIPITWTHTILPRQC
jgi:hypothetical protein